MKMTRLAIAMLLIVAAAAIDVVRHGRSHKNHHAARDGCTEHGKDMAACCEDPACAFMKTNEMDRQNKEARCWRKGTTGTNMCTDYMTEDKAKAFASELTAARQQIGDFNKMAADGKEGFDKMLEVLATKSADTAFVADVTAAAKKLADDQIDADTLTQQINRLNTQNEDLQSKVTTAELDLEKNKAKAATDLDELAQKLNEETVTLTTIKTQLTSATADLSGVTDTFKLIRSLVNKEEGHEALFGEMKKSCYLFFSCSGKCANCYENKVLYGGVVAALDKAGKGLVGYEVNKRKAILGTKNVEEAIQEVQDKHRFRAKAGAGGYEEGKAQVQKAVTDLDGVLEALDAVSSKAAVSAIVLERLRKSAAEVDALQKELRRKIDALQTKEAETQTKLSEAQKKLAGSTAESDREIADAKAKLDAAFAKSKELRRMNAVAMKAYEDAWTVMEEINASFEQSEVLGQCYKNECYDALKLKSRLDAHKAAETAKAKKG